MLRVTCSLSIIIAKQQNLQKATEQITVGHVVCTLHKDKKHGYLEKYKNT